MTTNVNGNNGFNINEIFNYVAEQINNKGNEVRDAMAAIKEDGNISDQQMLKMQFQINTYNTLLETASTVTKSLTDEAKQLAQRSA